ncbi:MAG: hypothetical protein K2N35_02175 [Muribaculaceae bacterium]|nr:hypothetical protein [Muribaculaceae bacterium]
MNTSLTKYFNKLNTTDNWKRHLIAAITSANNVGKSVVVVAIARKMARLFEYYRKNDVLLDNLFRNTDSIQNHLITEHAVPLCLSNIDAKETEIIILDDLMVFGDTVESVSENIFYLTGIKPKIIAMASTDLTEYTFKFGDLLYPNGNDVNTNIPDILHPQEIPAFTAKNNWNIISLDKSIDLEHTIFKIKGDFSQLKDRQDKILKIIQKIFEKATIYPVSHDIPGGGKAFSISILLDNDNKYRINDDFAKIRIFFGSKAINITFYTPNFWNETLLTDETIRFGLPILNDIWSQIKSSLSFLQIAENENLSMIKRDRMKRDFNLRIEQTAVVIANYLLSFESAMIIKPLLKDALSQIIGRNPFFEISSGDMSLLIGRELTSRFQPHLQDAVINQTLSRTYAYNHTLDDIIRTNPLIPSDSLKEYIKDNKHDVNFSSSVPMALSLIFYRLWKSFGLTPNRIREDKIRVGETFDSLFEILSIFFKEKDLMKEINRWVDSNIDLGVVVPKYEYVIDRLGYRVWRRYFRAGERESAMTDIARAALSLILDSQGRTGNEIRLSNFETEVYPKLEELSELAPDQLNLHLFEKNTRYFLESDGGAFPLWTYLVMLNAISLSDKDWDIAMINLFDGSPLFTKTALFLLNDV